MKQIRITKVVFGKTGGSNYLEMQYVQKSTILDVADDGVDEALMQIRRDAEKKKLSFISEGTNTIGERQLHFHGKKIMWAVTVFN